MEPGDIVKCESGEVGMIVASLRDYVVVDVDGELQCLLERELRTIPGRALRITRRDGWGADIEWSDGVREHVGATRLRLLQALFPWHRGAPLPPG